MKKFTDKPKNQIDKKGEKAPDNISDKCCCSPSASAESAISYIEISSREGTVNTSVGDIYRVSTAMQFADRFGAFKIRLGIGRMRYSIKPGLYAVGNPTSESYVFVTANYKISFDRLRSQLAARNCWIMVLNTKGINVWCAAGKGSFGTDEIIHRIKATRLSEIVSHRKLILPQLGAPGVKAHEVKKQTGFKIIYGPVRANDLNEFVDSHMKATPAMRHVRFGFRDRILLIPIEIAASAKYIIFIMACFFLLSGLGSGIYSVDRALTIGLKSVLLILSGYIAGTALVPALLPWLPGRSFSAKGAWAGLIIVFIAGGYDWLHPGFFENWLSQIAWLLIILTMASFIGMNFTGASTYTSMSGVRREMRFAVRIQAVCILVGFGLWLAARFI